jgi:CheY-like chemotaxis protein
MKKIFILEDDPNRVKWFKENLVSDDLHITEFAEEAMEWLRSTKFDAVFLDHDLGGDQMVSSNVWNTGSTVAQMIHETENKDLTVIIHSYNPSGADIMHRGMKSNGVKSYYFAFRTPEFCNAVKLTNELENE